MPDFDAKIEAEHHRVGVVICQCGHQIGERIDTQALSDQVRQIPGVVYASTEAYPCSPDGRERIQSAVKDHDLESLLIAGCAPRLVEKLFQSTLNQAGLPSEDLFIADIRELTVNVHLNDAGSAFREALTSIESGVIHLNYVKPFVTHTGQIARTVLILGSDLSALTVALALAEQGLPVTIVEPGTQIGELPAGSSPEITQQTQNQVEAVHTHSGIQLLLSARLVSLRGHPGRYEAWLHQRGQTNTIVVGAIIVSNQGIPKPLGVERWIDKNRVKIQVEFERELDQARTKGSLDLQKVVFFLCAEESQLQHCSRTCCSMGIRQAIQIKLLNPQAEVTVLFRELYLNEQAEAELAHARQLGVTFFRYSREAPPVIGDASIDIQDLLTRVPIQIPYERVVMSSPLIPTTEMTRLASLLDLPLDEWGFLAEPRMRLRPGRYTDPGIYVLGSKQLPSGTTEAAFQAYLTAARVLRLLNQTSIMVNIPVSEIDPKLCTGCGSCTQVCPVEAIHLERRDGILSLSEVDPLRCIGCGNCAVVCPVKAIHLPGWDHAEIPAQISALVDANSFIPGEPRILVMACEWSAYAAAETAGHRRISLPPGARLMRMNCSARFDPYHVLWALLNGADGVLLGACPPGECHYGLGNLYARERLTMLQGELAYHGIDPRRLRLEYFRVDQGEKYAKSIAQFISDLNIYHLLPNTFTQSVASTSTQIPMQ